MTKLPTYKRITHHEELSIGAVIGSELWVREGAGEGVVDDHTEVLGQSINILVNVIN